MNVFETLGQKVDNEIKAFREETLKKAPKAIYNFAYHIGFYEEFYEMLVCDFAEEHLSEDEAEWLVSNGNILEYLYDVWLDCDGAFDHSWDAMMDWIHLIFNESEE